MGVRISLTHMGKLFLNIHMGVDVCARTHITANMWRSEGSLQGSVLSFPHVDSGDQTQVIRLSSKHLYP